MTDDQPPPPPAPSFWRRLLKSAVVGVVLALACGLLPHDFRAPCRAVVNVCTGGSP